MSNNQTKIIHFYKEQLRRYKKIGLGNKTEHNVVVTEQLIEITKKRLNELTVNKLKRKIGGLLWEHLKILNIYYIYH